MSTPTFIQNEIIVEAPAYEVWDALTHAAKTRKYMFDCEPITTWEEGSELLWKGASDGVIYVKGNVVTCDPEKTLAYTVFDPNGTYPDIPQNYLTVTCALVEKDGHTLLSVTQGDYTQVADGKQRYEDTMDQGGWQGVLEGIKKVAEGG